MKEANLEYFADGDTIYVASKGIDKLISSLKN